MASAFRHGPFRVLFTGATLSLVGTWMQNVVVGPYALALSRDRAHPQGSATFLGLMVAAQFGPQLLLAIPGGVVANRVDRRRLMMAMQSLMLLFALILAWTAWKAPSRASLFLCVLGIGAANAINQPTSQAVLPTLVGEDDLAGAISLNAAAMNGSRVVGPIIVAMLLQAGVGRPVVFLLNALTFVAMIVALARLDIPAPPPRPADEPTGLRSLTVGIGYARRNLVARRMLFTIFTFSVICLPFIYQFPAVAQRGFHIAEGGSVYNWLYATWGFGAALGALAIGTVLAGRDRRLLVRPFLLAFCVSLLLFSQVRSAVPAFPAAFALGFFYFGSNTTMTTVFQGHLDARERAPVTSLWMMAFGGSLPIGSTIAGWGMDHWSVRGTLVVGALWAVVLAALADFHERSERMRAAGAAVR